MEWNNNLYTYIHRHTCMNTTIITHALIIYKMYWQPEKLKKNMLTLMLISHLWPVHPTSHWQLNASISSRQLQWQTRLFMCPDMCKFCIHHLWFMRDDFTCQWSCNLNHIYLRSDLQRLYSTVYKHARTAGLIKQQACINDFHKWGSCK